jgi:adenylate cyclase class 2
MSFEIEIKFRIPDPSAIELRLAELGASIAPSEDQLDLYLAHPSRDFHKRDEAFRIRRIGPQNRLTFKGPKQPGPTKTREEIELRFEDGPSVFNDSVRMFTHLGFAQVATIAKRRRSATLVLEGQQISVAIDQAHALGDFVEVEAIGEADEIEKLQSAVLKLAGLLGLSEIEPRSYLRMALESERSTAPPPPPQQA